MIPPTEMRLAQVKAMSGKVASLTLPEAVSNHVDGRSGLMIFGLNLKVGFVQSLAFFAEAGALEVHLEACKSWFFQALAK